MDERKEGRTLQDRFAFVGEVFDMIGQEEYFESKQIRMCSCTYKGYDSYNIAFSID